MHNTQHPASLDALPDDLLNPILYQLHCRDLFRLERVSKRLRFAIERHCWRHWHRVEWDESYLQQRRAITRRPHLKLRQLLSAILDRCGSHVTELYLDRILWDSSTLEEPKLLLVPEVFHSGRPLPMLHTLDLTGLTATSAADLIHISAHVGSTLKCLNLVEVLNHSWRSALLSSSSSCPPQLGLDDTDIDGRERPLVFSRSDFSLFLRNLTLLERLGISLNGPRQMAHLSFEDLSPELRVFVSYSTSLHPNIMEELAQRCATKLEAFTITTGEGEMPVEAINLFLSKASRLKKIELGAKGLNTELGILDADKLVCAHSLEDLVLTGYLMIPLTGKFSNLRKLDIDCLGAPLDVQMLEQEFEQLDKLIRLEVFSVSRCSRITDAQLRRLAMRGQIKELHITNCPLVTAACVELFLCECKRLRRLEGDDSLLTNDVLLTLQPLLDERVCQGSFSRMERVAFLHFYEDGPERSCNMHPWIVFSEGSGEGKEYRKLRL